jgi:hypothetical protein
METGNPQLSRSSRSAVTLAVAGCMMTLTEAVNHEWSIIPVGADKRPLLRSWVPFQSRRPTVEEIAIWSSWRPAAWAVITGAISGIVTLDFDGEAGRALIRQLCLEPHRRTGSGGFHLDVVHPGWHVSTCNTKSNRTMGKKWPGLDVRGDGGYAVFLGRNQSGPYVWLRDVRPVEAETLPAELSRSVGLLHPPPAGNREHLIRPMILGNSASPEHLLRGAVLRAASYGRNNAGFWLACQSRDNGFTRPEAARLLRAYVETVPRLSNAGKQDAYRWSEAVAGLVQAYARSARAPWLTGGPNNYGRR